MDQIPLNYEASQGDVHKQTTNTLPQEVVQCLENARFVRHGPLPRIPILDEADLGLSRIASPRDVHR